MRLLPACAFAAAIGGMLLAGPAGAAPDNRPGVALMAALVTSSGGLGGSATGVASAERTGTGRYEVTFVRPMSDKCHAVASLINSVPPGFVSASTLANGVSVETHNTSGVPSDRAFNLIVFCAR